ncbi:MAG: hypothetical protein Fur0018_03010 [Anaerolineales bacterium]
MQSILPSIDLLRYRVFLRVNASYVRVFPDFPMRLSYALGEVIRQQISLGRDGRRWRSALSAWDECGWPRALADKKPAQIPQWPDIRWPVETVFVVQPQKRFYGKGELFGFEIKLLGPKASHAFFLESILPGLEVLGYTDSPTDKNAHNLLGHFDVAQVYVARGLHWEPVVQDGKVDLHMQPDTHQWAEGWPFAFPAENIEVCGIYWETPCVLDQTSSSHQRGKSVSHPEFTDLLAACLERMASLSPQAAGSVDILWQQLTTEEQIDLLHTVEEARRVKVGTHSIKLTQTKWGCPRGLTGEQYFSPDVPASAIPYLELGSILHIGNYAHFGYGTFQLKMK